MMGGGGGGGGGQAHHHHGIKKRKNGMHIESHGFHSNVYEDERAHSV